MASAAPAPALTIAPIGDGDVADVIVLWQRCGLTRPWNDPASDIARARKGENAAMLVGRDDSGIEKLQLMVRPDNSQVQAFYQSLGYLEQERIIYAKWLDGREPTP